MASSVPADLLIITHESIGDKMAGPGIRAWEVARALGKRGVQVILATPFDSGRQSANVEIRKFSWEEASALANLVDQSRVVMAIGPVLTRAIRLLNGPIQKPTIVDAYYVPEIERILLNLSIGQFDFDPTRAFVDELFVYLRQGDFFICGSEKQYDFWLGALLTVGRLNSRTLGIDWTADHLIGRVPLGIPDEPPRAETGLLKGVIDGIGAHDKVLFWGGGVWDWNDPFTLLEALKRVLAHRDDVRVVFGSLHHYERKVVPEMSVAARVMQFVHREGWLGRYVFFQDWVPYDQRASYLLEADLGVTLNLRTVENRYAMRARVLDCLWASLPCILAEGDDSAQLLSQAGLARLVLPRDTQGVADAILQMVGDENLRARASEQARPYAEQLRWSSLVQPIIDFVSHPQLAPDAEEARGELEKLLPLRREWESLRAENAQLRAENNSLKVLLEEFRRRRAVRYADEAASWLGKIKRQ